MNVSFDEDVDTPYTIEVDFYVFVLVAITHPIQGPAMHVVLFVTCAGHQSRLKIYGHLRTRNGALIYLRLR